MRVLSNQQAFLPDAAAAIAAARPRWGAGSLRHMLRWRGAPAAETAPEANGEPCQDGEPAIVDRVAKTGYERCHPDDSWDDLLRRAAFSKEDRGLLRDWRAAVARGRAPHQ